MTFIRGKSGNPKGRPKSDVDLKLKIQARSDEILQVLFQILHSSKDSERLRAAELLLNRGWGCPAEEKQDKEKETEKPQGFYLQCGPQPSITITPGVAPG